MTTTLPDASCAHELVLSIGHEYSTPEQLAREWSGSDNLRPVLNRIVDAVQGALFNAGFSVSSEPTRDAMLWPARRYLTVRHFGEWVHPDSSWPFVVTFQFVIDYAGTWSGRVVLCTQIWDKFSDDTPRPGVIGEQLRDEVRIASAATISNSSDAREWEAHVLTALKNFSDEDLANLVRRVLAQVDRVTTP